MIRTLFDIFFVLIVIAFGSPIVWVFFKGIWKGIKQRKATHPPVAEPERHPCQTLHHFTPIDAQSVQVNELTHTAVLMYCSKCEARITATFLGVWPIESFLKKESDAARDIAKLEGMVR